MKAETKSNILWASAVAFMIFVVVVLYTWPLVKHIDRNIIFGCGLRPIITEYLQPGDHLQSYYHCWLLKENLLSGSDPFANPYEFSTYLKDNSAKLAMFPFSLLYVLFSFLGGPAAYNVLFFSSYLLVGIFGYLLGREVLESRLEAVLVALMFSLMPVRSKWAYAAHLYGFVSFSLPLVLWSVERTLNRRSLFWGMVSGTSVFVVSLMEPHLFYFSVIFLALYLPRDVITRASLLILSL